MFLLILSTTAVNAELKGPTSRGQNWDFTIQTRYAGEQYRAGEGGTSVNMEADLGWGFEFGYNLNESFNIGFLATWRSANYLATGVSGENSDNTQTYSNWLEATTMAITADWNILPRRITPYVSGALGWTLFDTNVPANVYSGCWYDPWLGYICSSSVATYGSDAFSYAVGVGLRLEVTETVFLRGGYEYDGMDLDGADGVNIFRLDIGFSMQ
jgi:opacity protein-like surface antigen